MGHYFLDIQYYSRIGSGTFNPDPQPLAVGRMTGSVTPTFSRCSRTLQRHFAQGNLQFSIALISAQQPAQGPPTTGK